MLIDAHKICLVKRRRLWCWGWGGGGGGAADIQAGIYTDTHVKYMHVLAHIRKRSYPHAYTDTLKLSK